MGKSLIETRPKYTECLATEEGWVDAKSGELLVSLKNLKSRLDPVESKETPVKRKPGRPKKVRV
jgi:hypothetical protein